MNLKLHLTNRGLQTSILQKSNGQEVQLAPNSRNFVGVGAYFWRIGVKLYLPLPVSWFFDRAREYDSRVIDIQSGLYLDKWLFDASLQWYSQLYPLSENEASIPSPAENGLYSLQASLTTTYLFSGDRVSFKSPYNRNEMQLESAGSWMLSGGFSYYKLDGEQSILGTASQDNFGDVSLISRVTAMSFHFRPGYVYNYVFGKFYLHTAASVGVALQDKSFIKSDITGDRLGVAPEYNLRAALGYDDGRYFASLFFVFQSTSLQFEELRINNSSRNVQFFVGYRLPTPAWLQKLRPALLDKILPMKSEKH
jgi:hypothetical protein